MSSQMEDAFNEAVERRASGYEQRIAALDDLVQRAWSLIAGAMSGNPHKPTANSDWMDAAHAWEIDYCMGAGLSGKTNDEKTEPAPFFTEQQERALARCEGYDEARAASPNERLREALTFYADKGNYTAQNPVGSGAHVWRDMGERARAALAAADREAPDEPGVWPDQSAVHGVLLDQIKDAYAEGIADTLGRVRVRAAEALPEVARFTLDEIETICADRAVEQRVVYRVRDRDSDYKAMCHENRDHAELLLKAWLADGRDAVIESRIVYDAGWNLLASSTAEKLASLRKRSASASDPMPLCDCEWCARPLRDHDEEEAG